MKTASTMRAHNQRDDAVLVRRLDPPAALGEISVGRRESGREEEAGCVCRQ